MYKIFFPIVVNFFCITYQVFFRSINIPLINFNIMVDIVLSIPFILLIMEDFVNEIKYSKFTQNDLTEKRKIVQHFNVFLNLLLSIWIDSTSFYFLLFMKTILFTID